VKNCIKNEISAETNGTTRRTQQQEVSGVLITRRLNVDGGARWSCGTDFGRKDFIIGINNLRCRMNDSNNEIIYLRPLPLPFPFLPLPLMHLRDFEFHFEPFLHRATHFFDFLA